MFTAVYDEEGTEGRFAARSPQHVVPAAAAADRAHVPPAAAALPVRDRGARPARLRPRDLLLERLGARRPARPRRRARLLLPQPVPLRVVRARGDARGARDAAVRLPLQVVLSRWRQWDWIAAQRVDRYVANSRLTAARVRALLRPRGRRAAPAGRARPLLARRGRRALPGAGRADGAQADRRRRRGLQPAADCRSSWSATAPRRGGCGGSPGPTVTFAGRLSDPEVAAAAAQRHGRSSSPPPRSSGSPPSRRWRRAGR